VTGLIICFLRLVFWGLRRVCSTYGAKMPAHFWLKVFRESNLSRHETISDVLKSQTLTATKWYEPCPVRNTCRRFGSWTVLLDPLIGSSFNHNSSLMIETNSETPDFFRIDVADPSRKLHFWHWMTYWKLTQLLWFAHKCSLEERTKNKIIWT
jgi:hypothetical protein